MFCGMVAYARAQNSLFEQGLHEREEGHWEQALKIWLSAKDSLSEADADPRIGFGFIKLATEKQAESLYPQASDLYFWGLSTENVKRYHDVLKREVAWISPILNKKVRAQWEDLLKKNNPHLTREMKEFWAKKDVIPTTKINERLLEHWQRIAYAKKNFKMNKESVYGTDDRGTVLVKFGSPDQTYSGKFGIDQQEIIRWIDSFLIRQEIQRYNNDPEFELWMYHTAHGHWPLNFFFGKIAGYGKYGLRYGVEDFIPSRAFTRSSVKNTGGILPGTMLQLMYYRELINVSDFFLDRYRELEARWTNARASGAYNPDYNVLLGLLSHFKSVDQRKVNFNYLETDRTNALEGLEKIYLNTKTFRYLDIYGKNRLVIFAVSGDIAEEQSFSPQFFKKAEKTRFKNRHVLIEYDKNWERQKQTVVYPALHKSNTSIFKFRLERPAHAILAAEKVILHLRKSGITEADIPDTAKVIGLASKALDGFEALHTDSTRFDVSDILTGVTAKSGLQQNADYPFPVLIHDPVKNSKPLNVYFEAYHVKAGGNAKATVQLTCKLKKLSSKKIDKKRERLQKKFTFESSRSNIKKSFTLNVSHLKSGHYELVIEFKDTVSRQTATRTARFYLIESL